jgi:hypothetical protein
MIEQEHLACLGAGIEIRLEPDLIVMNERRRRPRPVPEWTWSPVFTSEPFTKGLFDPR